jgi:hypothetical protein
MNALVVAAVVVVGHKCLDLSFQVAREVVVLQQNAVLTKPVGRLFTSLPTPSGLSSLTTG